MKQKRGERKIDFCLFPGGNKNSGEKKKGSVNCRVVAVR